MRHIAINVTNVVEADHDAHVVNDGTSYSEIDEKISQTQIVAA